MPNNLAVTAVWLYLFRSPFGVAAIKLAVRMTALPRTVCQWLVKYPTQASVYPRSRSANLLAKGGASLAKASAVVNRAGTAIRTKHKIRTSVSFHRPATLRLHRAPKYARKSVLKVNKLDQYRILRSPLTTESAMKKIEETNTLVFLVDLTASKSQVRDAVQKMYGIKTASVNTLIRPDGQKKAYIRLAAEFDALDVANRIGIL